MGLNVKYMPWDASGYEKQDRVAQLCSRKIVINKRTCPTTWKNLIEAGLDKMSRLPKLEKRTDQHGLDGLLHAIHDSTGVVVIPSRFKEHNKPPILGGMRRYNPLKDL